MRNKIYEIKYNFFLSIFVRSKVIAFFVKNLPKLNILFVIAIDLVELLKVFPVPGNFGALWCTTWQL